MLKVFFHVLRVNPRLNWLILISDLTLNLEILVLNDRSTDSTPVILAELAARDSRLVILAGRELPAGWAGKPHALYQAAKSAAGEWLLFVDADTFLDPNAVSASLASAQKTGAGLYTVMTEQITGSFWERVVMPLVMTALSVGFSPRKVNDPNIRDAIANGQFILIKHSVYNAIGGHEKLKNKIVEDKAISEQVKWNGYRLIVADGRGIAKPSCTPTCPRCGKAGPKTSTSASQTSPPCCCSARLGPSWPWRPWSCQPGRCLD